MQTNIIEENIYHELNKILRLCEKENKSINDNLFYEKTRTSNTDDTKLKYYHYFNISTREIMANKLNLSSERQLRRIYEDPSKILSNFELCQNMAKVQEISYIELMSRILGEKDTKINYKSSLIESIKELESQKSKEERRKIEKIIDLILDNNIDIDSFYDLSLFHMKNKSYTKENVTKIKDYLKKMN